MRALGNLLALLVTAHVVPALGAPAEQPPLLRADKLPITLIDRGVELTVESVRWERVASHKVGPAIVQRLVVRATVRDPERPDRVWECDHVSHAYWTSSDGAQLTALLHGIDPREHSVETTARLRDQTATDAALGRFTETVRFAKVPIPQAEEPQRLDLRQRTAQGSEIVIAGMQRTDFFPARYLVIARPPTDDPGREISVTVDANVVDDKGKVIGEGLTDGDYWPLSEDDDFQRVVLADPRTLGQQLGAVEVFWADDAPAAGAVNLDLVVTEESAQRASPDVEREFVFRLAMPTPAPPRQAAEVLAQEERGGVRLSVEQCLRWSYEKRFAGRAEMATATVVLHPPAGATDELRWEVHAPGAAAAAWEDDLGDEQSFWHADGSAIRAGETIWRAALRDVPRDAFQITFTLETQRQVRNQELVWLRGLPIPKPGEAVAPRVGARARCGIGVEVAQVAYFTSAQAAIALAPELEENLYRGEGLAIQARLTGLPDAVARMVAAHQLRPVTAEQCAVEAPIARIARDGRRVEWIQQGVERLRPTGIGAEHLIEVWYTLDVPDPRATAFDLQVLLTLETPLEPGPTMTFVGVPVTDQEEFEQQLAADESLVPEYPEEPFDEVPTPEEPEP